MKKLLLMLVMLSSCVSNDRFVKVSEQSLPKTVMISVITEVDTFTFVPTKKGLEVRRSEELKTLLGSGVFISPNGHVLTCAHLLSLGRPKSMMVCEYNGECSKADILYKEERLDLLLVKVETKSPFAVLADPRTLKIGQEVIAIGDPLGFEWSVSHGIISQLFVDGLSAYNMTQSDTFINPGNSGGPLFNLQGELVGINSCLVSPIHGAVFTGLGFSVQSGQIMEFLTRFRGLEKVKHL